MDMLSRNVTSESHIVGVCKQNLLYMQTYCYTPAEKLLCVTHHVFWGRYVVVIYCSDGLLNY